MKQKWMRLTWNGGQTIELKWKDYLLNKKYYDKLPVIQEEYWA